MPSRLIADIGGTNARFALAGPDGITDVLTQPVAAHPDFGDAIDAYLAIRRVSLGSVAVAAAGPRDGDVIKLTNAPWRIEGAAVSARLGGVPVRVLNDLEAVALCLPALAPGDFEVLAAGAPSSGPLPMLAANVGTGFGAALAVPTRTGWTALGTEAGHISLAAANQEEQSLLDGLRTVEDAFSGPGYARLFGTALHDGGETVSPVGQNAHAQKRTTYSRVFGRVLGDLALATGAWGGVFLTGGVISDLPRIVDVGTVLRAFRDKGKMAARMQRIALCRITADSPALRALATAEIG
jgi:glucokinase